MAFLVVTTSLPAVYRPNGYAWTTTPGTPHARAKTENVCQLDPSGRCYPEAHPKYLVSTQKWAYKSQKKSQKWPKLRKKEDFVFSSDFPLPIFLATPRCTFWTNELLLGTVVSWDMTETDLPLFGILSKKFNFFTDQNMIKAIAQLCAKTKGPMIKMNKINFEVHGLMTNLHLLIYVSRKWLQFDLQICQKSFFYDFPKKMKYGVL